MSLGISDFRNTSGGFFEREIKNAGRGLRQSSTVRLAKRIHGWFCKTDEPSRKLIVDARSALKTTFRAQLEKAEGDKIAKKSLERCGLTPSFFASERPLTNRMVKQVLNEAQKCRKHHAEANGRALNNILRRFPGVEFRDLRAAIRREIKGLPEFYSGRLGREALERAVENSRNTHISERANQLAGRYPNICDLLKGGNSLLKGFSLDKVFHADFELQLGIQFKNAGIPGLDVALFRIKDALELLRKQVWTTGELKQLQDQLETTKCDLCNVYNALTAGGDEQIEGDGLARSRAAVQEALASDVGRHIELIDAKIQYVKELRLIDPLTDRSRKHVALVATQACFSLLQRAEKEVPDEHKFAVSQLQEIWDFRCRAAADAYSKSENVETAIGSIEAPSKKNKNTHPVVQERVSQLKSLRSDLESANIPPGVLKKLFARESVVRAERDALSRLSTWGRVNRTMPVVRDGVVQLYRSKLTPAHHLHRSLGIDLGESVGGVTSGARDNAEHARNLKVSELYGPNDRLLASVVRHAVLDAWAIENPSDRKAANARAAKEVLELALSNNSRLKRALAAREHNPAATSPRLVHVSVNLITPDNIRDSLPLKRARDFKEKTYTFNQFEAFGANAGPNKSLGLMDLGVENGGKRDVSVNVDVITFSFGINALATGPKQRIFFGAWNNVHEHNTRNMVKFIGDLGTGRFGARGARPGGFVGDAYDRLDEWRKDDMEDRGPSADKLMQQLRYQTDTVRSLFTEQKFKEGNGDPAKMAREILVLQSLAEQALALTESMDLAGTMSTGCKSDKDRGGVADVELKTKLILRDMGGDLDPDQTLQGDDQGVYYTVSAGSGQLEQQQWNTGAAGSKEVAHLKERLPDPVARRYLAGLSKFVAS